MNIIEMFNFTDICMPQSVYFNTVICEILVLVSRSIIIYVFFVRTSFNSIYDVFILNLSLFACKNLF